MRSRQCSNEVEKDFSQKSLQAFDCKKHHEGRFEKIGSYGILQDKMKKPMQQI